jgi:GLPGLI family protein
MKIIILLFNLFFLTISYSQKGIVKYTAELNIEHKKEFIEEMKKKKGVSMFMKQRVINNYKNAEPDFYELHFNENESYYFKDKSLEKETSGMGSKAGRFPYYTNLTTEQLIEENVSFGYVQHEPLEWETTNQTKTIDKVKCYKATTTETLYSRQGHYYDREVVAWFAPDISVEFGPKYYNGLPGLVLEIERKEFIIKATHIDLSVEESELFIDDIEENENVITEKEMHKRIEEKMKYYRNR